jgi:hypothetical protein
MYAPAEHDEIEGIVSYVEQQLDAIRAAAIGLTDAQARERPCRSALSIGGLLKHVTYCMDVPSIVLTDEGLPASDFFDPYVPAAGTLGAA